MLPRIGRGNRTMNHTAELQPLSALSYWHGEPRARGQIRQRPEDFQVDETLSFTPSGEGEHLLLHVQKREANTAWVAQQIARHYGVRPAAVSWAGLKDRNAVTRQWFGVHLPGLRPPVVYPKADNFTVLEHDFNHRKLRVGAISHNQFRLRISHLAGDADWLQQRLQLIKTHGVPNYFTEQRFGRDGSNLHKAQQLLLEGRRLRKSEQALALSAARSYLFNQMLSRRIAEQRLNTVQAGDVLMLDQTKSVFVAQADELAALQARLDAQDCHTSCALPGAGRELAEGEALAWEQQCLAAYADWLQGLVRLRVSASRRAARLVPRDFHCELHPNHLELAFRLPAGAYATAVLRELLAYECG